MDKFKKIQAEQELYRDASIRREGLATPINDELNVRQREIGSRIHEAILPGMEYKGSAAVHIYFAPGLQELVYIPQNCIDKNVDEIWASSAVAELTRKLAADYGRTIGKKRSGF